MNSVASFTDNAMNLQRSLSVVLLFFTIGCADSATNSGAAGDMEDVASTNEAVEASDAREHSVVQLTDAAVAKFKEVLAKEPAKHIRLSVKKDSPAVFRYDLQLDDSVRDADWIDRSNGFLLVVDPTSSIFLERATIDWQTPPDGTAGFKFNNPNAVEE